MRLRLLSEIIDISDLEGTMPDKDEFGRSAREIIDSCRDPLYFEERLDSIVDNVEEGEEIDYDHLLEYIRGIVSEAENDLGLVLNRDEESGLVDYLLAQTGLV